MSESPVCRRKRGQDKSKMATEILLFQALVGGIRLRPGWARAIHPTPDRTWHLWIRMGCSGSPLQLVRQTTDRRRLSVEIRGHEPLPS